LNQQFPPLLDVRNLMVEVAGQCVVSSVSFGVDRGEILGIVGETGSGKSITCRALVGLLNRVRGRASGGSIRFAGRELVSAPTAIWNELRGRHIALVPQSSLSGLDPVMSIERQLTGAIRELDSDADPRGRALELLEMVEMPRPVAILKSYPHELSGGMRQRAMIALAIAGHPELLIADEPTTALDVTVQRAILDLLAGLCADEDMALILVTHDLSVVESVCHRVAVLYAGMTVEFGDTGSVISQPAHPYTRALLEARPGLDSQRERLTAIPGSPAAPTEWGVGCRFAPRCSAAVASCEDTLPELRAGRAAHEVACFLASDGDFA